MAGVALGTHVIVLERLLEAGLLYGPASVAAASVAGEGGLLPLIEQPAPHLSDLRRQLFDIFVEGGSADRAAAGAALLPLSDVELLMPLKPTAFTDYCASAEHIRRMGAASGAAPKKNWFALPISYNGRASSVSVSGTGVNRPLGQFELPPGSGNVRYGPEPMLDFELEFGVWLRGGNALGHTISMAEAEAQMFGCSLVNDWSARGIQFFEAMLGPHLGKSFLTTISPWIVTMEALAPFRVAARSREADEPEIPEHLFDRFDRQSGGFQIELTADLTLASGESRQIVKSGFDTMFWTLAQMVAHQASAGTPLEAGDLLASGTVSGPADEAKACMVEISAFGTSPIVFKSGAQRRMLEDGDTLSIRGRAHAEGYRSIGFGECAGTIQSSR